MYICINRKKSGMKSIFSLAFLSVMLFAEAQQISVSDVARNIKFNKTINEINNGKQKISYSDIQGIPYYTKGFVNARVGDTSSWVPIRYNSFLDTIEILDKLEVYEIPKEQSYPKFTLEKTNEKLVLLNTGDQYAGYFFELSDGKYRILRKVITKFYDAVPAPNSLISGTPARFEMERPIYFIKTENGIVRVPKNIKELPAMFPEKKDELNNFLKSNKIKLNSEEDLLKLGVLLNQ